MDSVCEGKTALHVAIEEGSPSAVKVLLKHNANMDLQVGLLLEFWLYLFDLSIHFAENHYNFQRHGLSDRGHDVDIDH